MANDDLTGRVIGAAIAVHRATGPGLLESAYEVCLTAELRARGIPFRRQVPIPVTYRGQTLDTGYRLDFLVESRLVVELKSVAALDPIHTAQVLTYLKLGGYRIGLLINFNSRYLGEGSIRRLVWNYPDPSAPSASSAVKRG